MKNAAAILLRVFPSLTDVAFLLPIIFLFTRLQGARHLMGDGDTGWHLRTGEWILANGRVPDKDIFSFTKPGEPWFAWEWLWDVIFGWLHLHWGTAAVVFASLMVLCVTYALLFRLIARRCDNRVIAIGLTALATAGSSMHWLARPHLFTLLFVVIFLHVLERGNEGRVRLLWVLPPLMVLWTNLHGGFFVGLFLIGCYAAGEWITAAIHAESEERKAALRRSLPYAYVGTACFAATFINPYFYQLHIHLVSYLKEGYHYQFVSEFQSLDFHTPLSRFFEPMILFAIGSAIWSILQRRYVYALMILTWLHLAFFAVRNIPIFLLIAAPTIGETLTVVAARLLKAPVAQWLNWLVRSVLEIADEFSAMDRRPTVPLLSGIMAMFMLLLLTSPVATGKLASSYDPERYPEKALAHLGRSGTDGRIYTDDEWGDYLIYQLYPKGRVFVDGRTDFYGSKFGEEYGRLFDAHYNWEKVLAKYGVDTLILRVQSPLATVVKQSNGWQVSYDDGKALVFRSSRAQQVSIANSGESPRGNSEGSSTSDQQVAQFGKSKGGQH